MASNTTRGIPVSKISPDFLRANATSHTEVFSAFAELIDNAYDPDVSASELLIDTINIRGVTCLIFLDNGAGMDRDKLHKMLSFGFCEKNIYENSSHLPIGFYGNGFKSGSMRIGADALVFTRCERSASIGFLSQTFLDDINAESVIVPILEYRLPKLERYKSQESRNNLNAILKYSVYKSEHELKAELTALEGSKTGTKIIIANLKRLQGGNLELDLTSDPADIRCPDAYEADMTSVYHRPVDHQQKSLYKLSLKEYCSILFLKPRMKITVRSTRVKSKLISKSLSNSEQDQYNPTWLQKPVKITFGFTCDATGSQDYGLMLYHRNRLIKAYEHVGYQKQPNELGVGVVGVAQVDFLTPIHNKQDFKQDDPKYNSVMKAFAAKLNEYWDEKMNTGNAYVPLPAGNMPDWTWVQCDACLKWRRLADSVDPASLPDKWFCYNNVDGLHNRCDIPEEPEDEDLAVRPKFEKVYKKKREEERRRQKLESQRQQQLRQEEIMRKLQEQEELLRKAAREKAEQAALIKKMANGEIPPGLNDEDSRRNSRDGQRTPRVPGSKRRGMVETPGGTKRMCIKTETGEEWDIMQNLSEDEETPEHSTRKSGKGQLRVAMSFPPSKSTPGSAPSDKDADRGRKKGRSSRTKDDDDDVEILDLTGEDDGPPVDNVPTIKPDPDGPDVKPDKTALDAQMSGDGHSKPGVNTMTEPTNNTAEQTEKNQTSESMETSSVNETTVDLAMAAIKERLDKENCSNEAATPNRAEKEASDTTNQVTENDVGNTSVADTPPLVAVQNGLADTQPAGSPGLSSVQSPSAVEGQASDKTDAHHHSLALQAVDEVAGSISTDETAEGCQPLKPVEKEVTTSGSDTIGSTPEELEQMDSSTECGTSNKDETTNDCSLVETSNTMKTSNSSDNVSSINNTNNNNNTKAGPSLGEDISLNSNEGKTSGSNNVDEQSEKDVNVLTSSFSLAGDPNHQETININSCTETFDSNPGGKTPSGEKTKSNSLAQPSSLETGTTTQPSSDTSHSNNLDIGHTNTLKHSSAYVQTELDLSSMTQLCTSAEQLEDVKSKLKLCQDNLDNAEAALNNSANQFEDLQSKLKTCQDDLAKREADLNNSSKQLVDVQSNLKTTQTNLANKNIELDNLRLELKSSQDNLTRREVSLDKLRQNVQRLLIKLAPGTEIGEQENIDQVLEDIIHSKEGGDSQDVDDS